VNHEQLQADLRTFGAPSQGIICLTGAPSPEHVPYLDLHATVPGGDHLIDAVVEVEHRPVLYVVHGRRSDADIRHLRRLLAQRGEADYLGILEPGQLHVFPVDILVRDVEVRTISVTAHDASWTIPRLALNPQADDPSTTAHRFHDLLFGLLTRTTTAINCTPGLQDTPEIALSWIGRALFFRFLVDRQIISPQHVDAICGAPTLEHCFATPAWASATSAWLDDVFNGNLLPLPHGGGAEFWRSLDMRGRQIICYELSKILVKADVHGQLSFGWETLDFGHIPVGLLSQVYENYSHSFEQPKAIKESIYYTPRFLAEYIVDEALHELPGADRARLLDPSSGAGVFLVAGLRALVRARWRREGQRPTREVIREILYQQIAGFDINEISLRLSALALYLTALELDPNPTPLSELKFEDLREIQVLHDIRMPRDIDEHTGIPVLGSLGPQVSDQHRGSYDVVVGNPPWTSWKRVRRPGDKSKERGQSKRFFDQRIREVEEGVRQIIAARLTPERAESYRMVDHAPDLPFFWHSLEWLRPGGRVALVLHARVLFKRTPHANTNRELMFETARITGILNGSALRTTNVWPGVTAQWCVFFAENTPPAEDDTLNFVSPQLDEGLNNRGIIRIDPIDSTPIMQVEIFEEPTLLKTLYRGSAFDASIMAKLARLGLPSLEAYWTDLGLEFGDGFQVGGPARPRQPAGELRGLPALTHRRDLKPRIDVAKLAKLKQKELLSPRRRGLYRAPLVLIPESPPAQGSGGMRVGYADADLVFSESFFGFSCHGYEQPKTLARYLQLILASDFVPYCALMQSSKFGVERDSYLLEDVKSVYIRPLETLSESEIQGINHYSKQLLAGQATLAQVNEFVYKLYGLTADERQTIRDTLEVSAPFAICAARAQARPSSEQVEAFINQLSARLRPFFRRRRTQVCVELSSARVGNPWILLRIALSEQACATPVSSELAALIIDEANSGGASLVTLRRPDARDLVVALLAQYRYWTPTRARFLARELRRTHENFLLGADA
jgi:hypothetical protein